LVFDLLIKNVRILDGTGNPWFLGGIGVKDKKLVAVGEIPCDTTAARVIDGKNLIAAPGFIDMHTHSEYPLMVDGHAQSKIRQGVTTEVTNSCGGWGAPIAGFARGVARKNVDKYDRDFEIDWVDFDGYNRRLERQGVSVNVVNFVGHGIVRAAVFGFEDRPPTADELRQMKYYIEQAMEQGCLGISTGIYYTPGCYATIDEIAECCKVAAKYNAVHSSHIRDESTYNIGLVNAIKEVIEIGRKSGVRTNFSHLKGIGPFSVGKSPEVLGILDAARAEGLDVTADQYPYTASGSGITGALLPRWAQVGGREGTLARLKDPETRAKMKKGIEENYVRRGGPEKLQVALCAHHPEFEGGTMKDACEKMGLDPAEAALVLLADDEVSFVSHGQDENDLMTYMKWGGICVGSDGSSLSAEGPLSEGSPHPRHFGTFPRILARYVREKNVITLPDAVRRMTSAPAQRLRIKDRGILREGFWADITLFDPDTVEDKATFRDPKQYPTGIPYVVVNGEVVLDNGVHTGKMPGKALKK
jgi:N-acyl-D-amino-acid deacylase